CAGGHGAVDDARRFERRFVWCGLFWRRWRGLARAIRGFAVSRGRLVSDSLRRRRRHLRVESGRRFVPAALPRNPRVLVFVLGIAGRTARLLDVVPDHGDNRVIGHTALAWTVVVQNVTKPKLALLHQISRRHRWRGKKRERLTDLSTTIP